MINFAKNLTMWFAVILILFMCYAMAGCKQLKGKSTVEIDITNYSLAPSSLTFGCQSCSAKGQYSFIMNRPQLTNLNQIEMEKFNELLEQLHGLKIIQKHIDWTKDLPEQLWNDHFNNNFKELESGLYVDTHRWYETSVSAIEIYGGILGIRHITNLFSESSMCEDCFVTIEFFEMKEVSIISYEKK